VILALALVSVLLAALPAVLAAVNLLALRTQTSHGHRGSLSFQARKPVVPHAAPVDPSNATAVPDVSILIPARDEAATIVGTVRAALATTGVTLEVLVGDDHSTDATASLVQAIAATDPRVRLVAVPALPEGWTGKNHACSVLAAAARGPHLLFIDADVTLAPGNTLAPGGAAALVAHAVASGSALVSAVPRQRMETLGERLTVPMIGFLLVGYLPIPMMRASLRPSLGAACGQLVLVDRAVYAETGGHAAIRAFLHDGVLLARLIRRAGYRTDLVAGAGLATCRMYRSWAESWAGFSKNAHEGMATPRALPVWTALLFGGHILPLVILTLFGFGLAGHGAAGLAGLALLLSLGARAAITLAMREPRVTIPLHPLTVAVALAIQWNVLLRRKTAGAAVWKGRSYPLNGG